jgi:phenylalanyl-tRNA synthetase beta chain
MKNSLSSELNVLRNSLLETALATVAHNLNHKNNSLKLFEFGKAYSSSGPGQYSESEHLCILLSGEVKEASWKQKAVTADFYYLKGAVEAVLQMMGIKPDTIESLPVPKLNDHIVFKLNGKIIAGAGEVNKQVLARFDIKQPVFFAGLNWEHLSLLASQKKNVVKEIPRYPAVHRDVAMVVPKELHYQEVEKLVQNIRLKKLQEVKLFDIFESEKLGAGKKSMALSFTFRDEEKTLTDKEIDGWMNTIMESLEKELKAEIRK